MHTLAVCVVVVTVAGGTISAQLGDLRIRAMSPYRIGLENMRAEAFEDAEKAFQASIDVDVAFEMGHYMLGRAQMPQKKFVKAAASFAKARDLYLASAGRKFASVQEAQRYRRERIVEIDDVIRQLESARPTQQTLNTLRQLHDQRRLLQERIHRGGDISIAANVPAYVSLSLGSAYFRMGNMGGAEKSYKEAISNDSKAGEAHSNLAVVYMETGRIADAEKALQAAEKAGFKVHPDLKAEIRKRKAAGSS